MDKEVVIIRREALKSLVEDAYKEGWFDGENVGGIPSHMACQTLYESYQHDWQHSDARETLDGYVST